MKKYLVSLLAGMLLLVPPALAQDSGPSLKPTPPPISCLDFFKGTYQFTVTGMYMKLGTGEDSGMDESPTGKGFNMEISRGFADGFGILSHFMYLGLSVPFEDPVTGDDDNSASAFGLGSTFVYDLKKGEKKDIAGEIIDKKPTVAIFAGIDLNGTQFSMENFMNLGEELSVKTTEVGFPMGMVADIPLNYFVSLVPFARFSWSSTSMQTVYPYQWIFVTSYIPLEMDTTLMTSSDDSTYTSTRFDYGMDIDLRLFRNAPEWKISVGTVLSQVSGLKDGNLIIMVSVKREWGKHYSSTSFGPKLH